MESAFRIWSGTVPPPSFPWPFNPTPFQGTPVAGWTDHDIGVIADQVEANLRTQGVNPRSRVVREAALRRVELAVNELGPDLFPLISTAEERVIGTREIPPAGATATNPRAKLYELHGIIDVLTDIELASAPDANLFKRLVQGMSPGLVGRFEVIVDYKGSRRPPLNHQYWQQSDWQVQTYAWLRTRQPGSLPVAAGILVYINELSMSADDLIALRREIANGHTDVAPITGSQDYYQLNTWVPGSAVPQFSKEFRLARAIRLARVDSASQLRATSEFDRVVQAIESCVTTEAAVGNIIAQWQSGGDEETCAACDFRYFCPDPAPHVGRGRAIDAPPAP